MRRKIAIAKRAGSEARVLNAPPERGEEYRKNTSHHLCLELRLGLLSLDSLLCIVFLVESVEIVDIVRTSTKDRHPLMQGGRDDVEHTSRTRRTLATGLFDQETHRIAFVQQTQLAVRILLVTGTVGFQHTATTEKKKKKKKTTGQHVSQQSCAQALMTPLQLVSSFLVFV